MKWEKVKLDDVLVFARNGASIKQSDGKSGIPVTRIETISDGYLDNNKFGYADIHNDQYSDYYLKSGDILMSHINSWKHLGKTALVQQDCQVIHGMNLLMLRPNKAVMLPRYANYYFTTNSFKEQLHRISNQSVNQSSFSVTKLRELFIPLPPLHIQEQIADTLDKADALRRKDQELLNKYDELAQSIFYDMFGDPVRNEKGWDVKKLLEVSRVFTGGTPARSNPEYFTGKIPWITSVALNNIFIKDSNAQGYITEDAIAESSTKKVKEGSLCFGIRVGVGKCSITQTELCINQDIAAITDFSVHCTPLFLRSVIKSFSDYFESIQKGATIQGVTTGDLKQLDIILPELSVQYAYDEKLKNILSQETSAVHNKENVDVLFQGILSQHFS